VKSKVAKADFFGSDCARNWISRKRILNEMGDNVKYSADYRRFGFDYFDNRDIGIGYGGYSYDGRYAKAAEQIAKYYNLTPGKRVLEVGCAKGYILVELHKLGLHVTGTDVSLYAIKNAEETVRRFITQGNICHLPYRNNYFDLVIGKEILPHIKEQMLPSAIRECMRVSKGSIFFEVQCGTVREELELIKKWDCTHKTIHTPDWWEKIFRKVKYSGDVHYKILFPHNKNMTIGIRKELSND
jgi:cyclopropane fatty-acyl-phospholipid synthase-like methyltransferase